MQSRRNCGIILGQPRAACENYDGMEGCPYEKALVYRQSPCGKDKIRAPLFDAVAQFSRAGYLVRV